MSLVHILADKSSAARTFIDRHFVFQPLSRNVNKELKALPCMRPAYEDPYLYMLAGTAADLMIRSLFDMRVHQNGAVQSGLRNLGNHMNQYGRTGGGSIQSPWSNGQSIWDDAPGPPPKTDVLVASFEAFIADRTFFDLSGPERERLAQFCILFARIDHFRRSLVYEFLFSLADLPLDEQLSRASTPELMKDVSDLSEGFAHRHARLISGATRVAMGRSLEGSRDVDGADFDFVADGTLFEIKTTIKPSMSVDMMRQAVAYWLLDYSDEFGIRRVAIELPRQGAMRELDLRKDLLDPKFSKLTDAEIRGRFRDAVRKAKQKAGVV